MLTIDRLKLTYGTSARTSVDALDGMSLVCPPRSIVALLGPSGAGKSTLLKAVAGITRPASGSITMGDDVWFDHRRAIDRPAAARRTGLMLQSYALWPHMTVREHLAFPLEHGFGRVDPRERVRLVDEMTGLLGLEGLHDRKPGELSGGQQQRLALGRAIINGPRLILLDEPFSNLDPNRRQAIARDIRRMQQQFQLTILIATHDHGEATLIADSLAVIIDGRLAQQASPDALYNDPVSREVAEFVGDINLVPIDRITDGAVHTPLGPFACASLRHAPRTDRQYRWLAFRPEAIRLAVSPLPDTGTGLFTATVRHAAMASGMFHVTLDASGIEIRMRTHDGAAGQLPPSVHFAVPEGAAFLL